MREFSLVVLESQLRKMRDIYVVDIDKGYLTYNFLIKELNTKFIDAISFQDYLVTVKIERDVILRKIYTVCNEILELYISCNRWVNRDDILPFLHDKWQECLSVEAINQVKAGFICLRVEDVRIKVFKEYTEIYSFNQSYKFDDCEWTNSNVLARRIQNICDAIEDYYPDTIKDIKYKLMAENNKSEETNKTSEITKLKGNPYCDIFIGFDDSNYNFFIEYVNRFNLEDLFNNVSFLVKKMKSEGCIIKSVSYKEILHNLLDKENLIPKGYQRFIENNSFSTKADIVIRRERYNSLKEEFRK